MRISKNPEVRRQEIVGIARDLFAAQGVGKTSMTEIAQLAGIAKGLVYYYFPSKEKLVDEVVEQIVQGFDQDLDGIVHRSDLDFFGKLMGILAIYYEMFQNTPILMQLTPADASVLILLRDRMSTSAFGNAKTLLQYGIEQKLITIEYPEYTLKMLITGLGDLFMEGVRDPQIHTTLIEQAIGLPKGRLRFDKN